MSPEPWVVASDAVALVGFSIAFVAIALTPIRRLNAREASVVRVLALCALGIYVFTALSNILEHAGVTAALDPYEDYIEILVFPLIAYSLYQARIGAEMRARIEAEQDLEREHGLLSTLMRLSPAGVMLVDRSGRIAFANEAAVRIFGLRVSSDGAHELPPDLRCTAMRSGEAPALDLKRLAEGITVSGALCALEADGKRLVLSVSSSPLPDTDQLGPEPSTLVLVLDVTEREMARQELMDAQARYAEALEHAVDARTADLLRANQELVEANAAKQQLLRNVSHELRTPLNVVIGLAEVLGEGLAGGLTEEQAKQVGMIREAGEHLLELVNTQLDAQRLESVDTVVVAEPVDVAQQVRTVVEMIEPLALQRGLELTLHVPDRLQAETDPRLLAQVLRNLLSNAVKFTEQGGIDVLVEDLGERFRVVVRDTGIGIPAEALPRIFDAFVQVPRPGGIKPEGTGLGLAICKQIAEALGGSIWVESEFGRGSTFVVELPTASANGTGLSVTHAQEA